MPTLSDLLKLRDRLQYLSIDLAHSRDTTLLKEVRQISDALRDLDTEGITKVIKDSIEFKTNALRHFQQSQIERINRSIAKSLHGYKKASRDWCNGIEHYDEHQYKEMLQTYYPNDEESITYVQKIVRTMGDWRDSCLLYQMNDFDQTDFLNFYPLYVVDRYKQDLIIKLSSLTTDAQMRKTRVYDTDEAYDCLPKGAFGMIISRNHFTHASRFMYDMELKFLSSLLKTGGMIMFNFNDVETPEGALLQESKMRSYQTKTELEQHLVDLGLEILEWTRLQKARTTWVLAKKPGIKTSIKRAEMLGHIIKK